jgi:type II secretory pathway pseudopilin PulG
VADRPGSSPGESGETLIEVLIAVLIIGIVSAALVGAILASLSGSEANRRSADADVVLRSYASDIIASSQDRTAWDSSSGCLTPVAVPQDVALQASSLDFVVSPPAAACSGGGFEGVVLRVADGGFTKSLEIWVRAP